MPQLAFYKGKGNWLDAVIRWVTRSPYSHVELILHPELKAKDGSITCYSSSARDGGVRIKSIKLNPDHWDLVEIDWHVTPSEIDKIFMREGGAKYDYWGLLFSQFFNWRRHSQTRWFCSEIIAFALGIPNANSYAPGDLKAIITKLNQIHRLGSLKGQAYV